MRCPGFGAPALPSARDFGPFRLLAVAGGPRHLRIEPAVAILHPPSTASVLANQVPRRGHLHPYKGTRGARIVSARRGESLGSFQRVQVRTASVGSGDIKRMVDIELVVVGVRPDSELAAAAGRRPASGERSVSAGG